MFYLVSIYGDVTINCHIMLPCMAMLPLTTFSPTDNEINNTKQYQYHIYLNNYAQFQSMDHI